MTQFEQLERLYNQFSNLADEIEFMVDNEEYNEAISKLLYKDSLINQFKIIKKTLSLDEESTEKMLSMEKELIQREKQNIEKLTKLRDEVANELNKTKKNVKLNSAYSTVNKQQGSIMDFSE